jgi:SRSO17 transposase
VREYVSGLIAGLERKNGWTLAEWAGEVGPDGMQRLLRRADWDVDGVRDDVRAYVVEQLGDPDGVLIADDTRFLKKGTRSAGVQRQYSGTAGRTENCQVGVFLAYASRLGHALIDRELYLPQFWTEDPQRCRAAGITEEAEFATKPRQARAMIARAVAAGVPFAWFTADETSDAVKLSSCCGKFLCGAGEGDGLVVVLPGGQAAVQAAEEPSEEVALCGGVPVAGLAAAVVVGAGAG